MSVRTSIEPPGLVRHKNPIPAACRKQGFLATSAIMGHDETGQLARPKRRQIDLAFSGLTAILLAAGMKLEDVVKVDLYFADKADRSLANDCWLKLFPDSSSRPARHSHTAALPAGCFIQITALAVADR